MPNSDWVYVMDLDSGTYFCLSNAVVIDSAKLSEDEIELLEEGSDSQLIEIGEKHGQSLPELLKWEPPAT